MPNIAPNQSLKRNNNQSPTIIAIVATLVIIGGFFVFRSRAASEELPSYFPNTYTEPTSKKATGNPFYSQNYLVGKNYVSATPSAAVLWFENVGSGKFKMYNSGPTDPQRRCHFDLFTWTDTELKYEQTQHTCDGANTNIAYSPGITYMPKFWDGTTAWKGNTMTSIATYSVGGSFKCTGVTTWTPEVLGWVEIAPGVKTIHTRTTQSTKWNADSGSDPATGCGPGVMQNYQDNLYLSPALPTASGSSQKGIKRSVGGSLERYQQTGKWDWDIWFDKWDVLPPV